MSPFFIIPPCLNPRIPFFFPPPAPAIAGQKLAFYHKPSQMPRYFLEVTYKGTNCSGFQIQDNAGSIQEEVEKALSVFFRAPVPLTGSSRTDTGVHAVQNFFHFDFQGIIEENILYNLNALLPADIAIKNITPDND